MPAVLETTVDKFIFRVATDRWYSADGVWAMPENGLVRIGVGDFLQQRAGDVAFVEVRPAGTALAAGDELALVETIKANVEVASPVVGTVIAVNAALDDSPELVNQDPYGGGWLALVEPAGWEAGRAALLDAPAYLELMRAEAEAEVAGS